MVDLLWREGSWLAISIAAPNAAVKSLNGGGVPLEVGRGIRYAAFPVRPPETGGDPMPTGTFVYRTEAERLAIEAAIAFVAEMHHLALAAPTGQVLDACEQHALGRGCDLLRSTLQQAAQARVDQAGR